MKRSSFLAVAGLIALLAAEPVIAQQPMILNLPTYGSPFSEIKTYQEQARALGGSKFQRQEVDRNTFEAGLGERGYERRFGDYLPNPDIEGIDKNIRLTGSDNPNQVKGAVRELLYEKGFTEGGEFKVLAIGKKLGSKYGRTDIDLYLQHRRTGIKVAVEVKENELANQNIDAYKTKIERLAAYSKDSGDPVVLLSRDELKPEIKQIWENNGAKVYDRVVTGAKNGQKSGNMRFQDMQEDLSGKLTRVRLAEGTVSSGFGLLLLYTSGSALLADLNAPHDDLTSKLRMAENSSLFVSGGAMTAVGISEIGSRFVKSDRALSVVGGVTKWGGRATLAGIIIAEPIALDLDYENWDKMTTGQQIGSVAQHGLNIGSGTYQAYRIYRVSRAAQTLAAGLEAAGAEEAVGDEASVGEIATVGGAPAAIPTQILTQGAVIVTLAGTGFVAGGQYAYDYLHPIPPSWNSSAFSGLSQDQKRQVEDAIYHSYGVAR